MPKNKFQDVIYTIIMASVMVYGMVAYNIVLNTGSLQNWVFLAVFHEWPIMTVIAILLELVFVGKLAMKVAFRLVNPREASQTSIMLAISAASVWLMCPCMSFFATLLFKDSHNAQFVAIWVQTTVMNFPMALLWQFFAAGPLVRRIFGLLFREPDPKKYEWLTLPAGDVWGVLMRRDAPLARKAAVCPEDLWELPLIISHQKGDDQQLSQWMGRKISELNVVATYNLVFNASLLVDEGLGYALCFDKLIHTEGTGLCFRPFSPTMEAPGYIVWKKYQIFSKAAWQFLQTVRERISDRTSKI